MNTPPPRDFFSAAPARWTVVVLAIVVHLPVIFSSLVWDDRVMLREPRPLHETSYILDILFRDYGWEFKQAPVGYYRPAFVLLTWLLYQITGATAAVYHLVSLCFFALLTWAVHRLLLRTLGAGREAIAFAAAAVFAVHPLNTEIVSFYTVLPDLLIALYATIVLLLVARACEVAPRAPILVAQCLGLGLLAGLTKESGFATLGVMAVVMAVAAIRKPHRCVLAPAAGALLAGLASAFAMRHVADLHPFPKSAVLAPFLTTHTGTTLQSIALFLRDFFLPTPPDFLIELSARGTPLTVAIVHMIVVSLIAGAFVALVRGSAITAMMLAWLGASFFGLAAAPALGMPYADRYGSIIPLLYCCAIAVVFIIERRGRSVTSVIEQRAPLPQVILTAVVLVLGVMSLRGVLITRSSLSLWSHVAARSPGSFEGRANLAFALREDMGDLEQSEKVMRELIADAGESVAPRHILFLAETLFYAGKHEETVETLREHEAVLTDDSQAWSIRAIALAQIGESAQALVSIRRAMELAPGKPNYKFQFVRIAMPLEEVQTEEIAAVAEELRAAGFALPPEFSSTAAIENVRAQITE